MSEHKLKKLQKLPQSKGLSVFDLVQNLFKKEYLEGWSKKIFFMNYVGVVKFTLQDQTVENITELEDIFQQVLEGD